jgi:hypothetical protein
MSTLFPSGKHIIHDETKLKELEAQIAGFMSKDPSADYTFRITAMSSKVPDYDGEKPNKPKVGPEFLPHERAQEVKQDLEDFVQNAKQTGAFKGTVNFQVQELPGEGPDWHPEKGDKKDDTKFTQHQGVKLDVISHTKGGETDYSIYASQGEVIHKDGRTFALAFYPARTSKDVSSSGGLNTGYQNILLRQVKPNTALTGKINQQGAFVRDYQIPWEVWNTVTGGSHDISNIDVEKTFGKYKVN